MCGGTGGASLWFPKAVGLSPRVRGNPIALPTAAVGIRSIPACAGEPPGCWRRTGLGPVYPRVCGGTYSSGVSAQVENGLSPRVRGNHIFVASSAPV